MKLAFQMALIERKEKKEITTRKTQCNDAATDQTVVLKMQAINLKAMLQQRYECEKPLNKKVGTKEMGNIVKVATKIHASSFIEQRPSSTAELIHLRAKPVASCHSIGIFFLTSRPLACIRL